MKKKDLNIPSFSFLNYFEKFSSESYELNELHSQTIEEGKNKIEEISSLKSEKGDVKNKLTENGEVLNGYGTLSAVDIENITNLVQGELCSIRQIIESNRVLMTKIKVSILTFIIFLYIY